MRKSYLAVLILLIPAILFAASDARREKQAMLFEKAVTIAGALSLNKRDESSGATVNDLDTSTSIVRISATVETINGAAGGVDGKIVAINNATASPVTVTHDSGSASAGDRFSLPDDANQTIKPGDTKAYFYDSSASRWKPYGGGGGGDGGSGEAVEKEITQNSHGFSVGNVLYLNGATYALADSDADATSDVIGIVSAVADTNTFTLTTVGHVTGLSGLTAGSTYFLSGTAGALTDTAPTANGTVNKPVLIADTTTSGYVIQSRGFVNGSTPGVTVTDWISYTPTFTGFGTVTNAGFFYKRIGDSIQIRGKFTAGTTTATEARISLPSGLTSDSTKLPSSIAYVGDMGISLSASSIFGAATLIEPSVTYLTFSLQTSSSGRLTKQDGSFIAGSGDIISVDTSLIPVTGF